MVKKLQKIAEKQAGGGNGSRLLDNQLASTVKDSAQQIWLAGLGAFSKAQEEGTKVFEALVKEGVSLQRKTQSTAEEKLGEVTGRMSAMAEGVSAKAGQQWDKLEAIFEERVAKAMGRLGVPSRKDIDALMARIDELSASVAAMSGKPAAGAATKPPAKKAAPKAAKAAAGTTAPRRRAAAGPAKTT
jgi:poly(hydroxyalkanoate) granule-associated protein